MSKRAHPGTRMYEINLLGTAVFTTESTEATEEMKAETSSSCVPSVLSVVKGLKYRPKRQPTSANTANTLGSDPFHFSPWNERDETCI